MTDEQAQLKAEELAAYADDVVEIAQGLGEQVTYEFEAELQLPHDVIDPAQPGAQIEVVYTRLITLITR